MMRDPSFLRASLLRLCSLSLSLSLPLFPLPFILSAVALKLFAFGRARKTFDRRARSEWTRQKKKQADISEAESRVLGEDSKRSRIT